MVDTLRIVGTGTSFSASEAALTGSFLTKYYREQTDPELASGLWERSAKLVMFNFFLEYLKWVVEKSVWERCQRVYLR